MARTNDNLPDDLRQGLAATQLAGISPYGSIAQRDNPSNYGSILRRKYPGAFGPGITTQVQDDEQRIRDNNRVLTLRRQNLELNDPYSADIYQNKRTLLRRRQQQQLDPSYPDLSEYDDGEF